MAWGAPHLLLPPVLLLLLALGSWRVTSEELHHVAGQVLVVRCQYPPKKGPYEKKTWCQERSPNRCTLLVTSSEPRIAAQNSRYTIWDDADAGFFIIAMIYLREEDSGPYWCGSYNASSKVITVFRNISLLVSPAQTTPFTWTPNWLPSTSVLITTPEMISSPLSTSSSESRQSIPPPPSTDAAASLVAVLYGLLVTKSLMLSALLVCLGCRHWGHCGDSSDRGF